MSFLPLVRLWIWISALATVAGWLLSALGELNRAGYAIFIAVVGGGAWLWCKRSAGKSPGLPGDRLQFHPSKLRARFRRWLPAGFAGLAFLVFLGSVCYAPTTHEGLSCRVPRVLHWLAESQWHWIHTPITRMNNRPCGMEWLMSPLLAFTHSDRLLFLTNFIPLLLLPGLLYSVFTRLGVRSRVAWCWMWLLPTGYNFLLQGGSLGNDTSPAIYALAAVDFALRAWESRRPRDLWLSFLSASLLTGAKISNVPLLLPWGIAVLPLLPLLLGWRPAPGARTFLSAATAKNPVPAKEPTREKPERCCGQECPRAAIATLAGTIAIALICLSVSFAPTAFLNARHSGDWSGLKLEHSVTAIKDPVLGLWGNSLLILKNLAPPFFPAAKWWNQNALNLLPHAIADPMVANFEPGFHSLGELPIEDGAGIGFGVSWLMLISVVAALVIGGRASPRTPSPAEKSHSAPGGSPSLPTVLRRLVLLAPWISLLVYFSKSALMDLPRHISAYYPLLAPALLIGAGQAWVVRRRWWRMLAGGVILLAVPVLVLTPGRPLWPAQTVLSKLVAWKPDNRLLQRALSVYTIYDQRSDPLAKVRDLLPPGLPVVGFAGTPDDIDISLWRPFGSRKVKHIVLTDGPDKIRERGITYAVVGQSNLEEKHLTLAEWQKQAGADLVKTLTATTTVSQGPQQWHLVKFKD